MDYTNLLLHVVNLHGVIKEELNIKDCMPLYVSFYINDLATQFDLQALKFDKVFGS